MTKFNLIKTFYYFLVLVLFGLCIRCQCFILGQAYGNSRMQVEIETNQLLKANFQPFEMSSCTVHVTKQNYSYSKYQQVHTLTDILDDNKISLSCLYCPKLFFSQELSFNIIVQDAYTNIFTPAKHLSSCLVQVFINLDETTKPDEFLQDDEDDILPKFQSLSHQIFGGIQKYGLPKKSSSNVRKSPDYILAFMKIGFNMTTEEKIYTELPSLVQNSKIIVVPILIENRNTTYFIQYEGKWLLGCHTCDKTGLRIDWSEMDVLVRLVVLIPMSNPTPKLLSNIQTLHEELNEKDWKMNDLGFFRGFFIDITDGRDCSRSLMQATFWEPFLRKSEKVDDCMKHLFSDWQNITRHRALFIRKNYIFADSAKFMQTTDSYQINIFAHTFASGVQFDGMRFSVILGHNENSRMGDTIKTNVWDVLVSPLSLTGSILVAVSIFVIDIVVSKTLPNAKGNHWAFWLYSVLLEQGDGEIRGQRNSKNVLLLLSWMFGCIILRNYYCSDMYSHLTKLPGPENIPETMEELFDEKISLPVYVEYDNSNFMQFQFEIMNKTSMKSNSVTKKSFLGRITENIKVVWLIMLAGHIIKNVTQNLDIECENYNSREKFIRGWTTKEDPVYHERCNTQGRFAMLYREIEETPNFYSSSLFIPLLEILGKRKILENKAGTAFLSKPILWFSKEKYFFHDKFQYMIEAMTESGILGKFNEGFNTILQNNSVSVQNTAGGFGNKWNMYAFSRHIVSNGYLSSNDDEFEPMRIEEFLLLIILYLYMITGCVFVKGLEVWFKQRYHFSAF